MRFLLLSTALCICLGSMPAALANSGAEEVEFMKLAVKLPANDPMPALVAKAAEGFLGRPYGTHLLDAQAGGTEQEPLTARLDAFDCVTLVETSLAIARTIAGNTPDWATFQQELEHVRYRDGKREGYASRLHYFSEWIADNEHRGLVQNLTLALGGHRDGRALTFMTAHRQAYPQLADDATFAGLKAVESHLAHRPRYVLPKEKLASVLPLLQSGDIVAIATDIEGLDVVHTGLIYRKPNGEVHLLHAPEPGEAVTVSSKPLVEYLQQYKAHTGLMIARPLKPAP